MRWITRENPKIDRVACPWLISRFIDREPEFVFVPASRVIEQAELLAAIPFDVEGVELTHDGPLCSFDAFLEKYQIADPALHTIATIVRGADTARLDLAPQCAGLLAVSLGLSRLFSDDHERIERGFVVYDALYAWCREAADETHAWNPQRVAAAH
ncbi:MAG TPA: chromate resistance protein ChrB domain-containing protein [Gemmatimonadaceae bacterium]|nr:chromate resistance protein ChrB domain-containing protein [Gemmatimonadaceae bacterium]